MTRPYAVVAITKHGAAIARRLHERLPDIDVYYPERFAVEGDSGDSATGVHAFSGSVVDHLPALFSAYAGLVGIFSLGAMVRLIAPLLRDKRTDPAIVVVDDRAQHAISVLSGHIGGANELTLRVAAALGAEAVITTASDVAQTIAVDLLGRAFGWEIENPENITAVSAAVVNEERILVIQESGERDWWPSERPLPPHISVADFPPTEMAKTDRTQSGGERVGGAQTGAAGPDAFLVITHRLLAAHERARLLTRGVLYRPKVIVLGVGCNSGTSSAEIAAVISETLASAGLAINSVRNVATIDRKANEPGLVDVCRQSGWPLVSYTAAELSTVAIPNPSETVFRYVGAYGVSEPAALLSSGAQDWEVQKVKSGNVTVSVCIAPNGPKRNGPKEEEASS